VPFSPIFQTAEDIANPSSPERMSNHPDPSNAVRAPAIVLLLALILVACDVMAQTRDSTAMPVIDRLCVHPRFSPSEIDWAPMTIDAPAGLTVEVMVPPVLENQATDLVIHFHGPAWLLHRAVHHLAEPVIAVSVNARGLSSAYAVPLEAPDAFATVLTEVVEAASKIHGDELKIGRIILSGFSAGYGAVRAILNHPPHRSQVAAVLLLDGMHAGYVTDGPANGRPEPTIDPAQMAAFVAFARDATQGSKHFLITHSDVRTEGYASTTDTARHLAASLGVEPKPVPATNGCSMEIMSTLDHGNLTVLGFGGSSAADHIDHLHALPRYLKRILSRLTDH
jgi:hypothetical protein